MPTLVETAPGSKTRLRTGRILEHFCSRRDPADRLLAVLVWAGLYLREDRPRALVPLRS